MCSSDLKSCAAALARWDGLIYAHFWAAQMASGPKESIAHHKRVIEIDVAQEGSWYALASLYRKTGDRVAEAELRKNFQLKFGRSIPQ